MSPRPRVLDLFCGGGGAGMGYHRAGCDVVGVDINPQPRYPFEFVLADALHVLGQNGWVGTLIDEDFDAIHASPPCQAFTSLRTLHPDRDYPELIAPTRKLLEAVGLPYVIENVPGAALRKPVVLCGSMFGLGTSDRQLRRHRLFECSFPVSQPSCAHHGGVVGVYGNGGGGEHWDERGHSKGYKGTASEYREAMGIDWMGSNREIAQAVPPAYTEHVGGHLLVPPDAYESEAA